MTDTAAAVVGAAVGLVCGVVTGAFVPWAIRRLPEPPPSAEPLPPDEHPKEPYVELGARPGLPVHCALLGGAAGAVVGGALGPDPLLLLLLPLVPVGTLLGVVDLRTRLLPRVVVVPATLAALGYGLVAWAGTGEHESLVRGLVGMVAARAVFWVLWFVRSAGMGFGDVRLSALLGFVLGYVGWPEYALGLYSGFLLLGLPGLVLAVVRRDRRLLRKAYPFGPFLLVGAVLGIALGEPLLGGLALA